MTRREALADARKAVVAVLGVVAQLLALGLIPAKYEHAAVALIAVATALGVYVTPNTAPSRVQSD